MGCAGGGGRWVAALIAALTLVQAEAAVPLLQPLIGAVLRNGPDSQLPAHLSLVLGISRVEQPVAVKQAVLREKSVVKTFLVSSVNHEDVVILSYDEESRSMRAYLTSASGALRKAVAYQAGAPAAVRAKADAAKDFNAEIHYWTSLARQPAASP